MDLCFIFSTRRIVKIVQLIFLPLSDFSGWKLASHQASVWNKYLILIYVAGAEARQDGEAAPNLGQHCWACSPHREPRRGLIQALC